MNNNKFRPSNLTPNIEIKMYCDNFQPSISIGQSKRQRTQDMYAEGGTLLYDRLGLLGLNLSTKGIVPHSD
jgi:hypothetical protein